jgi:hypothetical protein
MNHLQVYTEGGEDGAHKQWKMVDKTLYKAQILQLGFVAMIL